MKGIARIGVFSGLLDKRLSALDMHLSALDKRLAALDQVSDRC